MIAANHDVMTQLDSGRHQRPVTANMTVHGHQRQTYPTLMT